MIWCRFSDDGRARYGLVEDDQVRPVDGDPFAGYTVREDVRPLAGLQLLIPVVPPTFYCAGSNYEAHLRHYAESQGKPLAIPTRPEIGYRANNALIAHGDDIVKPADCGDEFKYEGELVAVIGRTAKHVSRDEAADLILGWTIGNDVSARDWQRQDRTFWRSKNADTFKPMGPWIVTGLDPADMTTTVRLNGEVVDRYATGDMIFSAADFISETSKYCTLHAGDVFWLGADGAPANMKVGDTVEVEITGIGVLRNQVRAPHG